uniref:Uncharacterized protein n=1 Tax=Arundo donax TaxID=35708 RepID=A0A0A9I236_ARUDO
MMSLIFCKWIYVSNYVFSPFYD